MQSPNGRVVKWHLVMCGANVLILVWANAGRSGRATATCVAGCRTGSPMWPAWRPATWATALRCPRRGRGPSSSLLLWHPRPHLLSRLSPSSPRCANLAQLCLWFVSIWGISLNRTPNVCLCSSCHIILELGEVFHVDAMSYLCRLRGKHASSRKGGAWKSRVFLQAPVTAPGAAPGVALPLSPAAAPAAAPAIARPLPDAALPAAGSVVGRFANLTAPANATAVPPVLPVASVSAPAPVLAPVVPVIAPVAVPVVAPVVAPVIAPVAAPVSAPVPPLTPTAPAPAPVTVQTPLPAPVAAPVAAPKISAPAVAPVAAPIAATPPVTPEATRQVIAASCQCTAYHRVTPESTA